MSKQVKESADGVEGNQRLSPFSSKRLLISAGSAEAPRPQEFFS